MEILKEKNQLECYLTYKEIGDKLGVSSATVRNWIKNLQIDQVTIKNNQKAVKASDFEKFRLSIENGEQLKLNKRANKKNSQQTFIPIEHLTEKKSHKEIFNLIEEIKKSNLKTEEILFIVSLELLKKNQLIIEENKYLLNISSIKFKNGFIKKIMDEWINEFNLNNKYNINFDIPSSLLDKTDLLGIIYQSLQSEGEKSIKGSYYTPSYIIENITESYKLKIKNNSKILDPCCGTGQFLISFSKFVSNPKNLYGFDIDKLAVKIAKMNMVISYPNIDFYPNITCQNSLIEEIPGKFDFITTNPPWGSHFSNKDLGILRMKYPQILSNEAFSFFIIKGLELLNIDGFLTYVLPESITKVKQHSDIRKELIYNTSIISIEHIGNAFTKVVSPVVVISLKNSISNNNEVSIKNSYKKYIIKQNRFKENISYVFDTGINEIDSQILNKVYSVNYLTLENKADWALGIVTGNNEKFLSRKINKELEPILKGSDICKYTYLNPSNFIKFIPNELQQVAHEFKYRCKEKLLYKFISKKLVFAYDNKGILTLNSANILIPKLENHSAKLILALFNSSLYQFIFQKKFNTVKILRGDLEQLPIPLLNEIFIEEIENRISDILHKENNKDEKLKLEKEIDGIIYSLFKLNNEEVKYIESEIK